MAIRPSVEMVVSLRVSSLPIALWRFVPIEIRARWQLDAYFLIFILYFDFAYLPASITVVKADGFRPPGAALLSEP
ncbi:MAG TPA: hypothetical protein VFW65_30595 [Pseudonocardiaceae bacterium]|nr:hypothetical protein [Pseudonocardiaceae bacterium]